MGRAWTPRAEEREGEEERVGEGEMQTALGVLIPAGAEQVGGGAARRQRPSGLKEEEEKKRFLQITPWTSLKILKPLKQQLHIVN